MFFVAHFILEIRAIIRNIIYRVSILSHSKLLQLAGSELLPGLDRYVGQVCRAFSGPAGVAVRTAWLAKAALLSAALVRLVQVWERGLGRRVVAGARWAREDIGLAL